MIASTEQRAGAASQAMISDEHITVSETVQWCTGPISHREAVRLRQLAGEANSHCEDDSSHLTGIRSQDTECGVRSARTAGREMEPRCTAQPQRRRSAPGAMKTHHSWR